MLLPRLPAAISATFLMVMSLAVLTVSCWSLRIAASMATSIGSFGFFSSGSARIFLR